MYTYHKAMDMSVWRNIPIVIIISSREKNIDHK